MEDIVVCKRCSETFHKDDEWIEGNNYNSVVETGYCLDCVDVVWIEKLEFGIDKS